jgi:hypothetical protein
VVRGRLHWYFTGPFYLPRAAELRNPRTPYWRLDMISWLKLLPVLAVGLGSAAFLCPLCDEGTALARAESPREQSADTAAVRLHISRMTCGSCPATARLALKKLPGVYSATVK